MLARFCIYGFLKNQRYYEPFWILIFLEKGLSFFEIGILFSFRAACVNLLEIPSGAIADNFGRRKTLIISWLFYILSFIVFGGSDSFFELSMAMLIFSIAESFRTGAHKAMIASWLRLKNLGNDFSKTYGITRSWSKYGSALSVTISASIVFYIGNYNLIFYMCIPPYTLGLINFISYPIELDSKAAKSSITVSDLAIRLWITIKNCYKKPRLRNILCESASYEGVLNAVKDYLQPALLVAASAFNLSLLDYQLNDAQRTALFTCPVYVALYFLSAIASRQAHSLVTVSGGERMAANILWLSSIILYLVVIFSDLLEFNITLIVAFIGLHVILNLWRPVLLSSLTNNDDDDGRAIVLSIESQARRVALMILAPIIGFTVDLTSYGTDTSLWSIGVIGFGIAFLYLIFNHNNTTISSPNSWTK